MLYLERNKSLTAELSGIVLEKKGPVRSGNLSTFTSIGDYESAILNRRLYLGIKQFKATGYEAVLPDIFTFQLGVVRTMFDEFPDLERELPAFMCLLRDMQGVPKGIITEDFTDGGRKVIENHGWAYDELKEIFVPGSLDEDNFAKMPIQVYPPVIYPDFPPGEPPDDLPVPQRENKLVDFYPLIGFGYRDAHRERFNEAAIEKELALQTVVANIA